MAATNTRQEWPEGVRAILHVDMDAFFAAVEQRENPELRGKPVIVGADPKGGKGRGVVSTCSYEARPFGIHSAQPISRAWKKCPQGIYVKPRGRLYSEESKHIQAIFRSFSDRVQPISIDEAFIDVTGSRELFGDVISLARKLKDRIQQERYLTASVGVAPNKFLAKVASDLEKPDGLVVVWPGEERSFLKDLHVRRLWGVGPKTEARLKKLGLQTIGEIADLGREELEQRLGSLGVHIFNLSHGIDRREVHTSDPRKSLGHEMTFHEDTSDHDQLHRKLLSLTQETARGLRKQSIKGRVVTLKYRYEDFSTYTRRKTLAHPADKVEEIFPVVEKLFHSNVDLKKRKVRLVGVSLSRLTKGEDHQPEQAELFDENPEKSERLEKLSKAVDTIVTRFGKKAIQRGTLTKKDKKGGSK